MECQNRMFISQAHINIGMQHASVAQSHDLLGTGMSLGIEHCTHILILGIFAFDATDAKLGLDSVEPIHHIFDVEGWELDGQWSPCQ